MRQRQLLRAAKNNAKELAETRKGLAKAEHMIRIFEEKIPELTRPATGSYTPDARGRAGTLLNGF